MTQPLVTAKQVAARWNCSPRHVYSMIERGEIPVIHLGLKLMRIQPDTIDQLEQALTVQAAPKVPPADQVAPPELNRAALAVLQQRIAVQRRGPAGNG